ncbi:hypothetical protein W03_15360 [Nitrosomonas sp. PY1]|uniref:LamG domain-containing protein n=1 Tax=Nitrosomonas sp. PY1 TaxID=1803906 RepID=UPI001FC890D2|nr:LamG domain-containing protein [Nitrosomonas sp. PY1]GKS69532.1 hypothetical protein W03_15360 [Nitrosomonas sp. PY1]
MNNRKFVSLQSGLFFLFLFFPISVFAESLVLEYKFASDNGSIVSDTSGNDLNGDIEGGGAWHFATGISGGRALKLNGIDNFVLVSDNPIFDFNHYTIMAWIKFKPSTWDRQELMEKAGSFWVNIREDTRKVRVGGFFGGCRNGASYFILDSSRTVPMDTWTHVAATYDGTILRIYINGVLAGKSPVLVPGPVCVNTEPLAIGAKHRTIPPPEDAAFFKGGMDTVRIFDDALPGWRIKKEMLKN